MDRRPRAQDPLIERLRGAGRPAGDLAEALGAALEDLGWQPAFLKLEPVFGQAETPCCRRGLSPGRLRRATSPRPPRRPGVRAGAARADRRHRSSGTGLSAPAQRSRVTPPRINIPEPPIVRRLLSPERLQRARALGAAMRLGCDLSGRSPELLAHARLEIKAQLVVLQSEDAWTADPARRADRQSAQASWPGCWSAISRSGP